MFETALRGLQQYSELQMISLPLSQKEKLFVLNFLFFFFSSFVQYLLLPKQGTVKTKKLQFLSPREVPLPPFFPLPSSLDSKAKKMLLCTLFIGGCLVHHNLILYDQHIF